MLSRYRSWLVFSLVATAFVLLVACAWPVGRLALSRPPQVEVTPPPAVAEKVPQPTAPAESASASPLPVVSISSIVRQVRPAVVQIANEQLVSDGFDPSVPQTAGIGSGVIYDREGHILTNYHVIAGAQQLTIALPDGRRFEGKLIGGDRDTDLAVVQIQGDNLPVAQMGRSGALEVGDWVVAIGNALGLKGGPTVTAGVVSALGRAVQEPPSDDEPGPYLYDLIQTDASINPGNSGGPLINLQGQVVGINTLVAGMAEAGIQAQGIGFAIAIDTAKPIADELVANGQVVHPYLGIFYQALNPALAARLGLDLQYGALIRQVIAGSPADKAGLQERDVIVAINGNELSDESTLDRLLRSYKPGTVVTLKVVRARNTITLRAELGEKPSSS